LGLSLLTLLSSVELSFILTNYINFSYYLPLLPSEPPVPLLGGVRGGFVPVALFLQSNPTGGDGHPRRRSPNKQNPLPFCLLTSALCLVS